MGGISGMGWVSGKKGFGEKVDGGGVRKQEVEAPPIHESHLEEEEDGDGGGHHEDGDYDR